MLPTGGIRSGFMFFSLFKNLKFFGEMHMRVMIIWTPRGYDYDYIYIYNFPLALDLLIDDDLFARRREIGSGGREIM